MKYLTFFVLISFSVNLFAFEKLKFSYSYDDSIDKNVEIHYRGFKFDSPHPILKGGSKKYSNEVSEVLLFFKEFYQVNLTGDKESIIGLWKSSQRDYLRENATEEDVELSRSRFRALKEMKLDLIIDYDGVLICYLKNDYGDQGVWPLEVVITKDEKKYYLTNEINEGDFFQKLVPLFSE